MLIYNSQKEFLGIDESDLELLGYRDFTHLRSQAADFSDLFVKTPGFIHNFKHVHWIDFITCADSTEVPKVIIQANDKNYRCNINITTAYLTDNPEKKAYIVHLQNVRLLTKDEHGEVVNDILAKPTPQAALYEETPIQVQKESEPPQIIDTPDIIEDEYEINSEIIQDNYDDEPSPKQLHVPLDIDIEDDFTASSEEKININEEIEAPFIEIIEPKLEPKTTEIEASQNVEEYDNSYVFDPQIASDELGLPIDLIEEFIEDFISQAKEFKDELYQSINDGDIDNVKILSHKLKGVAANLRVEDAYEVLATINTSEDTTVIKKNLDHLYYIISKLSGETVVSPPVKLVDTSVDKELIDDIEDDFVLEFKDDFIQPEQLKTEIDDDFQLSIKDEEVPDIIDVPELADDDFLLNEPLEMDDIKLENEVQIETSLELPELEETPDIEINDTSSELYYNKELIANEIGLDKDSFDELFEDYLVDSNEFCKLIKDDIDANNSTQWQQESLRLKGMSENMRMNEFSDELKILIETSQKDEATDAINKITSILSQLSKK